MTRKVHLSRYRPAFDGEGSHNWYKYNEGHSKCGQWGRAYECYGLPIVVCIESWIKLPRDIQCKSCSYHYPGWASQEDIAAVECALIGISNVFKDLSEAPQVSTINSGTYIGASVRLLPMSQSARKWCKKNKADICTLVGWHSEITTVRAPNGNVRSFSPQAATWSTVSDCAISKLTK